MARRPALELPAARAVRRHPGRRGDPPRPTSVGARCATLLRILASVPASSTPMTCSPTALGPSVRRPIPRPTCRCSSTGPGGRPGTRARGHRAGRLRADATTSGCAVDGEASLGRSRPAPRGPARRRSGAYRAALGLFTGEPLAEDRYDDWAQSYRERLLRLARTRWRRAACSPSDCGEPALAVEYAVGSRRGRTVARGRRAHSRAGPRRGRGPGRRTRALRPLPPNPRVRPGSGSVTASRCAAGRASFRRRAELPASACPGAGRAEQPVPAVAVRRPRRRVRCRAGCLLRSGQGGHDRRCFRCRKVPAAREIGAVRRAERSRQGVLAGAVRAVEPGARPDP